MKKETITILIGLVLLPSLAKAQPTLPLINLKIEPQFPITFTAGSTQNINISFDIPHSLNNTYALKIIINNTKETPPVWEEDFNISGKLEITYKTNGETVNFALDCQEVDAGIFICFNKSLANYIPPGIPPSTNKIILNVSSHPALAPGEYNFTFDVFVTREVGVGIRSVSQTQMLTSVINRLNTTFPDIDITVISNETGSASFTIISYIASFLPQPKPRFVKMFEIEPDKFLETHMLQAEITLEIPPRQLAGINKDSIDVYYWNGTDWMAIPRSNWTWLDPHTIEITTTHFSIWGIFGTPLASAPAPAPAGAGPVEYLRINIFSADTSITQTANTSQIYEVKVKNLGTVTATITLSISDLPSIYYTIDSPTITLESGETGVLTYTLNLPIDAESTTFKVNVNAVSGELTDSKSYKVKLTVIPPTVVTQEASKNVTVPVLPIIGVPVATVTGRFIAVVSQPLTQIAIGSVISAIVLIVIFRIVMRRRKPWRTRYGLSHQERLVMNLKRQIKRVIGE